VVGIDGLKIEPLPESLAACASMAAARLRSRCATCVDHRAARPARAGRVGGVAEYGITVR